MQGCFRNTESNKGEMKKKMEEILKKKDSYGNLSDEEKLDYRYYILEEPMDLAELKIKNEKNELNEEEKKALNNMLKHGQESCISGTREELKPLHGKMERFFPPDKNNKPAMEKFFPPDE